MFDRFVCLIDNRAAVIRSIASARAFLNFALDGGVAPLKLLAADRAMALRKFCEKSGVVTKTIKYYSDTDAYSISVSHHLISRISCSTASI